MPISDVDGYPVGHFSEVYSQLIEPAVTSAGYVCTLANSTSASHLIQLEVVTKVATADLCICDLSTNNPNVLFEYGIRQAFDRPTVLIKDDKTRRIFDLSGFRDIEYDHTLRIAKTLAAREAIASAIQDTVNGNGDESQIFSLVKLMKLTKAALPPGDVSQDDARFALLGKKIDDVIYSLNSKNSQVAPPEEKKISSRVRIGSKYSAKFESDGVYISELETGDQYYFNDMVSLEESKFWRSISKPAQGAVLSRLDKFSPNFIPF